MRVSSRGQYGVRALAYLAARYGEGPINVRTVAQAERLPAKYLEQLLAKLRRGGLVRSSRGARGGVTLARDPKTISIRQVISLLEGSLLPVDCLKDGSGHEDTCVAHPLWRALHESVLSTLDAFTLADLAERMRAREGKPPRGGATVEAQWETVGAGAGPGRSDVHSE